MGIANLIAVDRAIHELRSGRGISIDGNGMVHPEFIDSATLESLSGRNTRLIITQNRARALGAQNPDGNQQINIKGLSLEDIYSIICGQKFEPTQFTPANNISIAALELAKIAKILPCAIIYEGDEGLEITGANIMGYNKDNDASLKLVAEAQLKLIDAASAGIKTFRTANGGAEHLAIIIGQPGDNPLTRIHSSCYTGDLLGSLTCDCGDQLRGAIKLMDEAGGGIIIYLMQEGRGIGLVNKLRAYQLQAEGLDTVEANEFLGFDDEERSFGAAAAILQELGIDEVKLVTNNPKKTRGLEQLGIIVSTTVPLVLAHEHNRAYLATKSAKSGHIIK